MAKPKIKVLLVEDEAEIVNMYQMKFKEEGWEVVVSETGTDVLELAKKTNPDVVLLDIMLPGLDGFAILQELKREAVTKKIPVLLLSNLGQTADREKGKQLGATDYLVKAEFTPAQVVEKINKYIKR